jgi:hypothetical protein
MKMKSLVMGTSFNALLTVGLVMACLGCAQRDMDALNPSAVSSAEDGIALAIVYDNSGSMSSSVENSDGVGEPKAAIAARAFVKVVGSLEKYSGTPGAKKIQTGVVTFGSAGASTAVPMGDFNPKSLYDFINKREGGLWDSIGRFF